MNQYKIRFDVTTYSHVDVNVIAQDEDEALEIAGDRVVNEGLTGTVDEVEIDDYEVLEESEIEE